MTVFKHHFADGRVSHLQCDGPDHSILHSFDPAIEPDDRRPTAPRGAASMRNFNADSLFQRPDSGRAHHALDGDDSAHEDARLLIGKALLHLEAGDAAEACAFLEEAVEALEGGEGEEEEEEPSAEDVGFVSPRSSVSLQRRRKDDAVGAKDVGFVPPRSSVSLRTRRRGPDHRKDFEPRAAHDSATRGYDAAALFQRR